MEKKGLFRKTDFGKTCSSLARRSEKRKWRWCGSLDIVDKKYEW